MTPGIYTVDAQTGAVRMMYAFPRGSSPHYPAPPPGTAWGYRTSGAPHAPHTVGRYEMSGALVKAIQPAQSTTALLVTLGLLALVGGGVTTLLAKLFGATWAHAAWWGTGGGLATAVLGYPGRASAAPVPVVVTACPDGSLPPGGNITSCPPPKMGDNDPDAPPGGWVYNAPVSPAAQIQAAATALAAVDPCQPANVQLVRNFQGAAGLAQMNDPGSNNVHPPGTDGRYGGDTAKALGQYVPTAPPACYDNAHPIRPSWWGPVHTYQNPQAGN
jgi:hypothetical protein